MPKQPHATTPSSPIETKNPDFAGDCWRFGSKLRHAHSAQEIRDNKTKGFDLVPPSGVEGAFSIKHDPLYSPDSRRATAPWFHICYRNCATSSAHNHECKIVVARYPSGKILDGANNRKQSFAGTQVCCPPDLIQEPVHPELFTILSTAFD